MRYITPWLCLIHGRSLNRKAMTKRSQYCWMQHTLCHMCAFGHPATLGHPVSTCYDNWVFVTQIWPFSNLSQQHTALMSPHFATGSPNDVALKYCDRLVEEKCNLVPRASFPLTSGRKTGALGTSILK